MGAEAQWSLELEADRSRRFRRLIWLSALAHAVVVASLMLSPRPTRGPMLPAVVEVQLHAALPSAPAPAPDTPRPEKPEPPPPAPAVEPKPKPPVPEKIVLPEEPKPLPKPKPKPKPKPAVARKPDPKPPPAPVEESYDDFLESLRAERAAKQPPAPAAVARAQRGPAGPSGPGIVLPPDVVAWMRNAKVHVTRAWVLAPNFRTLPLETEIAVRVDPSGAVRSTRITRRSGNPWFDESVERAIQKASPLPPPPDADEWSFIFRPEDVY